MKLALLSINVFKMFYNGLLIIPHQSVMEWLFSEDQVICDAERMGVHFFSLIWTLSLLSTGFLDLCSLPHNRDFPGGSDGKASACNAGDLGLIPGSGRSPVEGSPP